MSAAQLPAPAGDTLTILTTAGPRLTKVWDSATGKPQSYERAQQVSVQERHVTDIYSLGVLLDELEVERNSCIIRGRFIGHVKARELYPQEIEQDRKRGKTLVAPKEGFTLRRKTFFKDQPLHYCYFDIDSFKPVGLDPVLQPEACINQFIETFLPACFQGITYHWQLSSGAGHPDNAGVLKAHVAFWLTWAYTGDDLEAWVKAEGLPIDVTVFRTVQPNYTAAPVFTNGVADPVPVRSGLCEGFLGDSVDLVIDPVVLVRAKAERKERAEMVDPREKDGLIGLFHRTFEIEEVVERWLSDVFEFVTDTRLTWLLGGGAGEGAGVTDNRQGIFNTHNTDPLGGRATNKWDLVRHYVFGHLDAGLSQDERFLLGPGGWPSQQAMTEMVRSLPEISAGQQGEVVDSAAAHRAAVEAAADEAAVRAAAQRIALDAALDPLARDILVGAIQTRLRALTGIKPTVAAVRAMVAMRRERGAARQAGGPEWVEPWVYVTGQAKFFNRQTKESITREAFDAAYNRFMEPDDDGNVLPASRAACEVWQCPVVYGVAYLPSAGDLFTLDGQEYVNLYRPDTVPSSVWDAACSAILDRHITLLVPDETYRKTLLQWLAWVVRNPGRKVLWAVLIKGVEGDGKSILGNMLGQAMGFANVGIISPDTLSNSSFNDWAVGRCVNVVEELKLQGHNRHDVVNKIKPLITNERIELHGKGKAATTAINTTNYLAFSNHADAIPLDQHDRRQFVLFTPWASIADMHAAVAALGLSMDAYWDQLWGVVKNRPDAVRGYFDAVDLAGFDPHSRAPATVFKDAVVAAGDLDDAEAIAKFHIEEGAHGVSASILSSACLTKLLAERDPPVVLHTTRVRKLLEGMGFKQVPGLLKWKGMPHRVWIRVTGQGGNEALLGAAPAELRAALDLTAALEVEDFLK